MRSTGKHGCNGEISVIQRLLLTAPAPQQWKEGVTRQPIMPSKSRQKMLFDIQVALTIV